MSPELSRRVARALGKARPSFAEREQMLAAAGDAWHFDDLPPQARQLLQRLEQRAQR